MEENNPDLEQTKKYICDKCSYSTDRHYNLTRHRERIHKEREKKQICCGQIFATKADFYLHMEIHHPNVRKNAVISRNLYKIRNEAKFVYDMPKEEIATFEKKFFEYLSDVNFEELDKQLSNKSNNNGTKKH